MSQQSENSTTTTTARPTRSCKRQRRAVQSGSDDNSGNDDDSDDDAQIPRSTRPIATIKLNHVDLLPHVGSFIMSKDGKMPKDAIVRFVTHPTLATRTTADQLAADHPMPTYDRAGHCKFQKSFQIDATKKNNTMGDDNEQEDDTTTTTQQNAQTNTPPQQQIDITLSPQPDDLTFTPTYSKLLGMLRFANAVCLFVNLDMSNYPNLFGFDPQNSTHPILAAFDQHQNAQQPTNTTTSPHHDNLLTNAAQYGRLALTFFGSPAATIKTPVMKHVLDIQERHKAIHKAIEDAADDVERRAQQNNLLAADQIYLFCRVEANRSKALITNNNYLFCGSLSVLHCVQNASPVPFILQIPWFSQLVHKSVGFYHLFKPVNVVSLPPIADQMKQKKKCDAESSDGDEEDDEDNKNKKKQQPRRRGGDVQEEFAELSTEPRGNKRTIRRKQREELTSESD